VHERGCRPVAVRDQGGDCWLVRASPSTQEGRATVRTHILLFSRDPPMRLAENGSAYKKSAL